MNILRNSAQVDKKLACPDCFDSIEQYREWVIAARSKTDDYYAVKSNGYCLDCTPEYQQSMIDQWPCAYPGATFELHNAQSGVELRGRRKPRAERKRFALESLVAMVEVS